MSLVTPVIFLIFRRPDLTAQVFKQIRLARPQKLFIVADGPRDEKEALLCQQARAVTEQIDWDCEVFRNYSDVNLGCRERVSSGITWAFEHVEEAIILEDDCLPHPCFFSFCQALLKHYRDDERIFVISGNNFQAGQKRTPYSYYFSKYNHCWGWATWKRAWKYWKYDRDVWIKFKNLGLLSFICDDSKEENYWSETFDSYFISDIPDSWGYAWTFACWSQGGLTVLPERNLVSNIGFREDATHTLSSSDIANLPTFPINEIVHPPFIVRNRDADIFTFFNLFSAKESLDSLSILSKLRKKIKKLFMTVSESRISG